VGVGDVAWVERSAAPGEDALDAPFGLGDHLGRGWAALDQAVEVRRGAPAQDRSGAACLDGSEVVRLAARGAVADAVDARVFQQQRARSETPVDRARRDTRIEELRPAHHAVLFSADLSENPGHRPGLASHSDA
jgi:hypothetical protein